MVYCSDHWHVLFYALHLYATHVTHQALTTCFAFLPPAGEKLERVFADGRVRIDGRLAQPDLVLSSETLHTIELLIHMHEPEVSYRNPMKCKSLTQGRETVDRNHTHKGWSLKSW